jgi:hypothetical protein
VHLCTKWQCIRPVPNLERFLSYFVFHEKQGKSILSLCNVTSVLLTVSFNTGSNLWNIHIYRSRKRQGNSQHVTNESVTSHSPFSLVSRNVSFFMFYNISFTSLNITCHTKQEKITGRILKSNFWFSILYEYHPGGQPKARRRAFSARILSLASSVDNEVDNDVYVSSSLETQNGTVYTNYFVLRPFYFWNWKEHFQEMSCAISKS